MTDRTKAGAACGGLLDYVPLFDWKPEYDLGLPLIDMQHRGIVASINTLHYAVLDEYGEDMLEPIVTMIKDYCLVHFMTEEVFFGKCGFPEAERHAEAHREMIGAMLEAGQISILTRNPRQFLQFLKDGLVRHILDEDRVYRDFVLERGRES